MNHQASRRIYDETGASWLMPLALFVGAALALLSMHGCGGTQGTASRRSTHGWVVNADASLSVAARGLDTVGQIAAQRRTIETNRPDANFEAIDARYAPVRIARNLAHERLVAAEVELRGGPGRDGNCSALIAVRLAREAVTAVGVALAIATNGSAEAPALADAVRALVDSVATGPRC